MSLPGSGKIGFVSPASPSRVVTKLWRQIRDHKGRVLGHSWGSLPGWSSDWRLPWLKRPKLHHIASPLEVTMSHHDSPWSDHQPTRSVLQAGLQAYCDGGCAPSFQGPWKDWKVMKDLCTLEIYKMSPYKASPSLSEWNHRDSNSGEPSSVMDALCNAFLVALGNLVISSHI